MKINGEEEEEIEAMWRREIILAKVKNNEWRSNGNG
jgi:hypothetical protein